MATTPEGRTKASIKDLLAAYDIKAAKDAGTFDHAAGWYWLPLQGPMTVRGIPDVVGHYLGVFWAIEAKAPSKKATGYQALQISAIQKSGGAVFVIDGPETLKVFQQWLDKIKEERG